MAITAFPLQATGITFGESQVYNLIDHLLSAGVASGLGVVQNPAGADMSVTVQPGSAYVAVPSGGKRLFTVTANSNSGVPGLVNAAEWIATFTAANATNPRVDRVVAQVQDNLVDGSGQNRGMLRVVAGTPTAGATLSNLSGAAAVPSGCEHVRYVLVPAGATAITNAEISVAPVGSRAGGGVVGGTQHADHCVVHSDGGFVVDTTTRAVAFPDETEDTLGMHDATNNSRITPKRAGVYRVSYNLRDGVLTTNANFYQVIRVNGADMPGGRGTFGHVGGATPEFRVSNSVDVRIAAGDYLELALALSSGTVTLNTDAAGIVHFTVTRLGD